MAGLGKFGLWAGGVLFGTAGIAILSSADAKKVYTHATAAVKRGAGSVMQTYTTIKENCLDINADADDINEARAKAKEEREIADAKATLAYYEARKEEEAQEVAAAEAEDNARQ